MLDRVERRNHAVVTDLDAVIELVRSGQTTAAAYAIGALGARHREDDLDGPLRIATGYLGDGDVARAEAMLDLCARLYRVRLGPDAPRARLRLVVSRAETDD